MTTFRPGDRVHLWQNAWLASTTGTVTGTTPEGRTLVRWDDGPATTPHYPHHLEPAGEPMSTFKSIAPGSKATIEVAGVDGNVTVYVHQNIGAIDLDAADAPALALAILEAAGVEPLSEHYGDDTLPATSLSRAAHYLSVYANQVNAAAKEAADQEALEAEALHLCRIMWDNPDQAWTPMSPEAKAKWLKMARTARTLRGVTK